MKLHGNAALSLNKRRQLAGRVVEEGWSLTSAAAAAEVSVPTARKWASRYSAEGEAGLLDRSSAEQLPLLEAAEGRHGTKRAALLAGLEAEAKASEPPAVASKAKDETARSKKKAETEAAKEKQACEALKSELVRAQKALAKSERELAQAKEGAVDAGEGWNAERAELQEDLEERDEELAELRELAVDEIYCGRCGCWVPAEEWVWKESEGEGSYASHHACGDHGPGMISASSWLARREP